MNVIVFTLDACRADRLGAWGYGRDTTPVLDGLARDPDAVVFRRHYVHGASTKPSTASLFTGLRVERHGVNQDVLPTDRSKIARIYRSQSLDESFLTLAEAFQAAGFETLGVVKSSHLVREYGFGQGFDRYVTNQELKGDGRRVARALELIREAGDRFFLYVHLNACHHPFREAERDAEFMDRYGFPYAEAERQAAGIDFTTPEIKFAARRGELELSRDDVRWLSLVYDAQLRRVDRTLVAPFLDGLHALGHWNDTLLLVTADHGEELYEHQGYAHGHAVWEEISHVPLIVKFPRGLLPEALRTEVREVTSSLDIFPALLTLLGRPVSPELPGVAIFTGRSSGRALLASRTQWGVVTARNKWIQTVGGPAQLFDLERDPGEQIDLAARQPRRAAALKRLADPAIEGARTAPLEERVLKPDELRDLRALGYVE